MECLSISALEPEYKTRNNEIQKEAAPIHQGDNQWGRYNRRIATGAGFVAQVAEVEVNPATGQVHVRRMVTAADIGCVLNPIGATGQLEGGMVMGFGGAVMEDIGLAEGRVQAVGLRQYKLPTAGDVPARENIFITTGGGQGPYGAKAVADQGLLPAAAAIANAVYDAVGVRIDDLPITADKVYAALKEAKSERPANER